MTKINNYIKTFNNNISPTVILSYTHKTNLKKRNQLMN